MDKTINWGILGCGPISRHFAKSLLSVPGCRLSAVAARDYNRAKAFAEEFGSDRYYGNYEQLASDNEIDIVYIATITQLHMEHALMCMERGKAVLCEKPLAASGGQAKIMAEKSRECGVFLMEAMWSRFLPANREAARLVSSGAAGVPRIAHTDIGVCLPWEGAAYTDPAQAGGALIGAGVYAVAQAYNLLGWPEEMTGFAHIGESGVDEYNAVIFRHAHGALSLIASSIRSVLGGDSRVFGDKGEIFVPSFQNATKVVIRESGRGEKTLEFPHAGYSGFTYEIAEAADCVRAGKTESEILPLDESVSISETDEKLRNGWGLYYPCDKKPERRE